MKTLPAITAEIEKELWEKFREDVTTSKYVMKLHFTVFLRTALLKVAEETAAGIIGTDAYGPYTPRHNECREVMRDNFKTFINQ